jgi:hypothetical protein
VHIKLHIKKATPFCVAFFSCQIGMHSRHSTNSAGLGLMIRCALLVDVDSCTVNHHRYVLPV